MQTTQRSISNKRKESIKYRPLMLLVALVLLSTVLTIQKNRQIQQTASIGKRMTINLWELQANKTFEKEFVALDSNNKTVRSHVLLIYVYANTHKYAYGNLKYFIEHGVRENDGVDYIFILQQTDNKEINETEMPPLPKGNAFYIQHENRCFDFGTIGWFFQQYTVDNPWIKENSATDTGKFQRRFKITQYRYFIFMNSSIRGPFLPPYFLQFILDYQEEYNKTLSWYHIFIGRINEQVKLVGCTISCSRRPHVQSYFLSTDFTGLSILMKNNIKYGTVRAGVFGCYPSKSDTTDISELGISSHIVDAGYKIDCLLKKYYHVNFSPAANYTCSIAENPYADRTLDGVSLEPYEVVFIKYNDRKGTLEAQERAKLYERWMEQAKTINRTSW